MATFQCGKWHGTPAKGTMTPREHVGHITVREPDEDVIWDVLHWLDGEKSCAVQVHVRETLSAHRKIFFQSETEAKKWLANPINPTIEEIKAALQNCEWHEPSKGRIHLWANFFRS